MKPVKRTGNSLLKPAQAVAAARRWIEENRLNEMPKYALLVRKDVEVLTPLLVREEPPIRPLEERSGSRTKTRTAQAVTGSLYVTTSVLGDPRVDQIGVRVA